MEFFQKDIHHYFADVNALLMLTAMYLVGLW